MLPDRTLQISQNDRSIPHCLTVSFDSDDSIEIVQSDSVEKTPIQNAEISKGIFTT